QGLTAVYDSQTLGAGSPALSSARDETNLVVPITRQGSPRRALEGAMRAWGIGGLAAACLALVVPSTAFAAGTTFNVNTTNDTLSAGACAAATAGQCSLREAVIESNATPPTANTLRGGGGAGGS